MLCSLLSYRHLVQHPAIFSFTSIYRRSHCPLRSHPSTCSFLSSVVRLLRARAFAMQPLTSQQPLLSQLNSQQQSQQQQQSQLHTPSTHNQLGLNNTPSTSPTPPTSTTTPASNAASPSPFPSRLYQHVLDLTSLDKREAALLELSKKREEFPDLAPILWHSFGTISALLQEIVSIYPLLSPPRLTPSISNRCCNALALLQCVASHTETRGAFLNSHLGLFLYPFLNTVCTYRQYEYLRLTSLGVIGALVKMDDSEVISFLLQTEIIPLCLRIMDNGSELSKTVATFIIQKILLDEMGLNYICATYERFSTVASVLSKMITGCIDRPSVRLLKHIVRCYLRLSDNARARDALRGCLPVQVRDATFVDVLKDDPVTKRWLAQLLYNIGETTQPQQSQQQQQSALAGAGGQQGSAGGASGQSLLQGGQMGGGGNGGTSAS